MANSSHSPPSAAANEDSDEEEENDDFSPTPRVLKAVPKGRQVKAYVDFYANKSLRYAEDMNGRPGVWARVTRAEELDGEKRKANIKKLFLLDTGATLTRIPEQWKELLHVDALVDADGRPITKKVNNALGSLERETIRIILTVEDGEDELCSVELTATAFDAALWEIPASEAGRWKKVAAHVREACGKCGKTNLKCQRYKEMRRGSSSTGSSAYLHRLQTGPSLLNSLVGVDFIRAVGWDAIKFGYNPKTAAAAASLEE